MSNNLILATNIRYGKQSLGLLAQAAHQLKSKLPLKSSFATKILEKGDSIAMDKTIAVQQI